MKATYIDYSDTNSFSATLLSYISEDPNLKAFISNWPTAQSFNTVIAEKKVSANRSVLVNVLKKQYSDAGYQNTESALVHENINSLSRPDTFTVTTGHQLNIFTGPLYFIYKIVTAINLAAELKSIHPHKIFVPVYWMATEDHDFEEINHVKLHGKKHTWNDDAKGATGRIDPISIRDTLKSYQNALGFSENTKKLSAILEEAYLNHTTLADATRYLVHHIFAKYGLVILDADDAELKKQFAPIIKADILEQNSFRAITETSKNLQASGFNTQVHAREINFFYLKDGLRERLVYENKRWEVLNTTITFNELELATEIDLYPERFSPNVVMRPLYQEVILPNLAYIGGGAEIVYWLQLKQNFDQYGISFPILIPRNSALVTGESFSNQLNRLNLSVKDLFKDTNTIKKDWVVENSEHTLSLSGEWQEFSSVFEKLKLRAYKIDSTLAPSAEAVKARLKNALSNLEQKLIKAEKRNHQDALSKIEHLRNKYFPANGLQERTENFGLFYTLYDDNFIAELVKHFKPLDFKFTILEP
ncbi:MAG: bacillithiol biosynthesis cysteine-adding enzyme BshC [Sphingobacteriaceae bacterium]|nr:bacillithiol biosynthesis cysteine-adding enzyme BshC [Sphingobacteriaceae bacterium]